MGHDYIGSSIRYDATISVSGSWMSWSCMLIEYRYLFFKFGSRIRKSSKFASSSQDWQKQQIQTIWIHTRPLIMMMILQNDINFKGPHVHLGPWKPSQHSKHRAFVLQHNRQRWKRGDRKWWSGWAMYIDWSCTRPAHGLVWKTCCAWPQVVALYNLFDSTLIKLLLYRWSVDLVTTLYYSLCRRRAYGSSCVCLHHSQFSTSSTTVSQLYTAQSLHYKVITYSIL